MPTDSGEGRRRAAEGEPEGEGEAARERCPRCLSKDTKFCYYNNYNTAQPRHFCKSCRRYWTVGGALRNVPIGGCSRKRPRRSPSSYAAGAASVTPPAPPADFPSPCAPAGGVFGHLLSSAGFLALGEPFLEGRVGFELGLGLGLGSGPGPTPSVEELGFGLGTSLLWPSSLLDEEIGDTWRIESGAEDCFAAPAAADGWRDLAVSAPGGRRSGGHDHDLN